MVIKQILKDIRKEWAWALFYTIVATMIAMAILSLSSSFAFIRRQSSAITAFINKNVVIFQVLYTQMEPAPADPATGERLASSSPDIMDYLQDNLSAAGKAGSFCFIANSEYVDKKYEQILILPGQYGSLAGLDYEASTALFVPDAHKEDVGKRLMVAGQEIEVVDSVSPDFDLFHPLHYFESGNASLSNALILCTRDFQTVNSMFPAERLSDEAFFRMALVNPSDAEVDQLQRIFYNQYGGIYTGISTEDFTQVTTLAYIRAHRIYMWFYVLSGVLLILITLCNIIRMIEARVADYTVHHLYGAPVRLIQRRVGGFILFLNSLPVIGILYVLAMNKMTLWYILPLCVAIILVLYIFVAGYVGKRIGALNSLENLRRDY